MTVPQVGVRMWGRHRGLQGRGRGKVAVVRILGVSRTQVPEEEKPWAWAALGGHRTFPLVCHGARGEGGGAAGSILTPYPLAPG